MSEQKCRVKLMRNNAPASVLLVPAGANLLEVVRGEGILLAADCSGMGICGRCRVRVNGVERRACRFLIVEDLEVELPDALLSESYAILQDIGSCAGNGHARADGADLDTGLGLSSGFGLDSDLGVGFAASSAAGSGAGFAAGAGSETANGCVIAIDLGTTTVAGKLLELSTGTELASFAQLNAQLPYGADVISRINHSLDDASVLSALIRTQLDTAISGMLAASGVEALRVQRVVIAGNTAMAYLLLNLPCRSLGFAPFEPAYRYSVSQLYGTVFAAQTLKCTCIILPYISAFVGGDLTAGLCTLGAQDDFILMDLGTNGELVFKRGQRLLATAAAAGPAFEGGSIECGTGSVVGAIAAVGYQEGAWQLETLGGAAPCGLCGSGILDLMAVMLRQGFIDETGAFTERVAGDRIVLSPPAGAPGSAAGRASGAAYSSDPDAGSDSASDFDSGSGLDPDLGSREVYFSQKDVRQFQLAKSAVRTGLAILGEEMGGALPSQVFLAGGFGQNLNPASALAVGLLPPEFAGRVRAIGNSSLRGAVDVALAAGAPPRSQQLEQLEQLALGGQEINLAAHLRFNEYFTEFLCFEPCAGNGDYAGGTGSTGGEGAAGKGGTSAASGKARA